MCDEPREQTEQTEQTELDTGRSLDRSKIERREGGKVEREGC
jgi:hypothetical protein